MARFRPMASFRWPGGTAQAVVLGRRPRLAWPRRGARRIAAGAAAFALAATALILGSPPGHVLAAVASAPLCRNGQHANVTGGYTIVNGDFNATSGCIVPAGQGFTVTSSPGTRATSTVRAFPFIFRGCSWTVCAPAKWLPARVSTLTRPVTSVRVTGTGASGLWNAAYDIWIDSKPIHTGWANEAEVMIWLDYKGVSYVGQPQVTIDGARWYKMAWITCRATRQCWRYISYRRVRVTASASKLALGPFLANARVQKSWYMLNVEFGFEIWYGGKGLGVRSFTVSP